MALVKKSEVRKLSDKNRMKVLAPELDEISKRITEAAEAGYYNVVIQGRPHYENRIRLTREGYKVKQGRLSYKIQWGDY